MTIQGNISNDDFPEGFSVIFSYIYIYIYIFRTTMFVDNKFLCRGPLSTCHLYLFFPVFVKIIFRIFCGKIYNQSINQSINQIHSIKLIQSINKSNAKKVSKILKYYTRQ